MKYIFDFDDVLFNNTAQFKKHMFEYMESIGVPRGVPEEYYKEIRGNQFSIRKFISGLLERYKINGNAEEIYEKMLSKTKDFLNVELLEIVKKLGKDNCYLVTQGNKEFHEDKIKRSRIATLFREIIIVPEFKKSVIENICEKHKDEEVIFIDDRQKFFDELDLKKCPNLKTILYDAQGLEKLKEEIKP